MNMKRSKELDRHIEVVLKALDILDCLQGTSGLTIKQIIERTGMSRSRVTRLIGTLESRDYVEYKPEERQYLLGFSLLPLGRTVEQNNNLASHSRAILRKLVEKTGELASLYIIDGTERVALLRENATHVIRYSLKEGQRMEIYAGAAGKVLLAYAPHRLQNKVINTNFLRKLTPNTIIDPMKLIAELEEVRRRGYSFSKGEREKEVGSIAAPVFDHQNKVCAALGLAGPLNRFTAESRSKYLGTLLKAARELSKRLGWSENLNGKEGMP